MQEEQSFAYSEASLIEFSELYFQASVYQIAALAIMYTGGRMSDLDGIRFGLVDSLAIMPRDNCLFDITGKL